jgi:PPOX class probable F420-dependent enzyme
MLNLAQAKDAHINQRLQTDKIIWFATIHGDRPHMVPVWFLWDGSTILIFSKPNALKVRDIRQNSNVTLALQTNNEGGDVVVIEGEAVLLDPASVNATLPAYAQKYAQLMQSMGMNAQAMAAEYSVPIRVTPTRFISWE